MRIRKSLNMAVCVFAVFIVASATLTNKANAVQPPVDVTTLYVGAEGWGPSRADPVRAHDDASYELIFNVYDTLIFFKGELYWKFEPRLSTNVPNKTDDTIVDIRKNVTSMDVNLEDPTGSPWSDGSICVGWVDNNATKKLDQKDIMYMMEQDGTYRTWQVESLSLGPPVSIGLFRQKWIFHIRTQDASGNPIRFVDEGGNIVGQFNVSDAEYSFERGLVQDQRGSPMWMFYKPFFDQMNSDPWDTGNPGDAYILAHLIGDAIEVIGSDLIINLGMSFPEDRFKQILSLTWASIVDEEFSVSIGCWDGDLYGDVNPQNGYPDWWDNVRRIDRSPYDANYRYVGTGPYRVKVFKPMFNYVLLEKNDYYWGGWDPFPGGNRNHFERIEIRYIAQWEPRRDAFMEGYIDICEVPRAYIVDLVEPDYPPGEPMYPPYTQYIDVPIKTIKNLPTLSMDAIHFTFTLNSSSEFMPTRTDTGEPLPNFFNNTHVRKAFCYAFNHTDYIRYAWYNEALWRNNMLIYCLLPDYYDPTCGGYNINVTKVIEELKAVVFPDGKTLYETGFRIKLAYNAGNDQLKIVFCMLYELFGLLGPQFVIEICELDLPSYLYLIENFELPIWGMGWHASFDDADNFARTYMHSYGRLAYFQNYTSWNGWGTRKDELIDMALKTPDGPDRKALYKELQIIYYQDAPFLPLDMPIGRRWQYYWVRYWYYNALYPADYYYWMYKEDTCWFDITGRTLGVPDYVTDARDVTYLIKHF
ncbi:MAG: ABC transporter substrate-binding protein, partial [Candidatus Bathyarchaeia archaeon]